MPRWFLSYHSTDQALAERLKAAIERRDPRRVSVPARAADSYSASGYPWGDDPTPNGRARWRTAPAAAANGTAGEPRRSARSPNALGPYGGVGNALEWTEDCWNGAFEAGRPTARRGRAAIAAHASSAAATDKSIRSAARYAWAAANKGSIGFRVARTLGDGDGASAAALGAH